jgi:hypothetical protein
MDPATVELSMRERLEIVNNEATRLGLEREARRAPAGSRPQWTVRRALMAGMPAPPPHTVPTPREPAPNHSLVHTLHAQTSHEIRALQLSGEICSELESESELYGCATVRRASGWIGALATITARWRRHRSALARAGRRNGPVTQEVASTVADGSAGSGGTSGSTDGTTRNPTRPRSDVGITDGPATLVPDRRTT